MSKTTLRRTLALSSLNARYVILSCLASLAFFMTARRIETAGVDMSSASAVFLLVAFVLGRLFYFDVDAELEDALRNALKSDEARRRFERTPSWAFLRGMCICERLFRVVSVGFMILGSAYFLCLAAALDFVEPAPAYRSFLRYIECGIMWSGAMWACWALRLRRAVRIVGSEGRSETTVGESEKIPG